MRRTAAAFVLVLLLASPLFAQQTSALINQQLDKPFSLTLKEETLPDAMKEISKETGVPIVVDPTVWDLLPWGDTTIINANIQNNTLRDALTAITGKLALKFSVEDEDLSIEPIHALRRLGRRSTLDEISSLSLLSSTDAGLASDAGLNKTNQISVKDLLQTVDKKLQDAKTPYAVENRSGGGPDGIDQELLITIPRNATLMDALEELHKQTNATWYPWGKDLVILPKHDEVRRLLEKKVTVRYNKVDVAQVVPELLQRAGVVMAIEPGAFSRIPAESRDISLQLDNSSVTQALEAISGITGLGYEIKADGVVSISNAAPAPAARDKMVGLLNLPDSGMQIVVTESQLTPELRAYLKMKTQKEIDKINGLMKDEGFQPPPPATEPTTKPANGDL